VCLLQHIVYQTEGCEINLKNLDKVFWPEKKLLKADLLDYYAKAGPFLIPYLKDRPFTLKRYPDGIYGKNFYQKECPGNAPDWLQTVRVTHGKKAINYCLVNKNADLLWLINQGCIELHTWLATHINPANPDFAVFDLDPAQGASWKDVLAIAKLVGELLKELRLKDYPKTSGASGLHIYIPIQPKYDYQTVQKFIKKSAELVVGVFPEKATMERSIEKRRGKVYLDYLQNGPGRTMASVYSVRPVPEASVSMPITWEEINETVIFPDTFTIENALTEISNRNSFFSSCLKNKQDLASALKILSIIKHF